MRSCLNVANEKQIAVMSSYINYTVPADYTGWNIGNGARNDMVYKLNVLFDVLQHRKIKCWIEPCSGYGISIGLIKAISPQTKLIMNDIEYQRYRALQKLGMYVTNLDYNSSEYIKILNRHKNRDTTFIFFDPYNFTANKAETLEYIKKHICVFSKWFISDVFCYSLKPFDKRKYKQYLKRLQKELNIENITAFVYPNTKCAIITNIPEHTSYPVITNAPSIYTLLKL